MALPDLNVVPALGHGTLAPLRELIDSPAIDVVSTDIFDTLLWRGVSEPILAFDLVGRRLQERGELSERVTPPAFANLRRLAEQRVRHDFLRDHGTTEIRLAEIYDAIPAWVFGGAGRQAGMDAELEVERNLLVPDLDVLELLMSAHEKGKTVIAVSDIYFSADQLRFLLGQEAVGALPFRHIFSSSDHRDNKSGKLFDIALAQLGVAPERVLHMGDNEAADVESPKAKGIRVAMLERRSPRMRDMLVAEGRFAGPATALAAAGDKLGPMVGSDLGLSALRAKMEHRAELAAATSALQPFWRYGAQVYGPVLTGFGEWVHRRARDAGADKAFCLMREGHFLTTLLDAGAGGVESPVAAEKLWLNRDLCIRAAIGSGTRDEIETLFFRRTPPTVRDVCRTLGIGLNELPSLSAHADTRLEDPILRSLLLDELTADGPVQRRIAGNARELRERIVEYVLSVVGDADPIVLVDLGWGATIQSRLAQALQQAGIERRVVGLYLVTHEGAASTVAPNGEVEGFLANLGAPSPVVDVILRAPEVLEQTCMPAHGSQRGISEDLQPVIGEADATIQHVEAEAVRRGVLAFQREYLRYHLRTPGKPRPLSHAADLLAPILMRSIAQPTAEEAELFGRWMHDENFGSDEFDSMVDESWRAKLRHLAPEQLARLPMQDVYWPFGLATIQDPGLAELAAAVKTGLVSEDAATVGTDTGQLVVEAVQGVGIEGCPRFSSVPRRNRHGLSFVRHTLNSGSIERLQIKPGEHACAMRIDWIELRIWSQGSPDPVTVRLESTADFGRLDLAGVLFVAPNLFVTTGAESAIGIATSHWADRVVFRVDVEVAFASMAIPTPLPGPGSPQALATSEAVRRQMEASVSWRLTAPIRRLKRLGGR